MVVILWLVRMALIAVIALYLLYVILSIADFFIQSFLYNRARQKENNERLKSYLRFRQSVIERKAAFFKKVLQHPRKKHRH